MKKFKIWLGQRKSVMRKSVMRRSVMRKSVMRKSVMRKSVMRKGVMSFNVLSVCFRRGKSDHQDSCREFEGMVATPECLTQEAKSKT